MQPLSTSSLNPAFVFCFEGMIFRILTDSTGRLLAVEVRNEAKKEVSFSVADLSKGMLLFENLGLEEPWWAGMSAIEQGRLFLYEYADRRFPDPKGIIAVDVFAQEIAWQQPGLYLEQATPSHIVAAKITESQRNYYLLEPDEGKILKELDAQEVTALVAPVSPVIAPLRYSADSEHFNTIATFLQQRLLVNPLRAVHYLEHGNFVIISYDRTMTGKVWSQLLIMTKQGDILFNQTTGEVVPGVGTDTFFVVGAYIIALKDKNSLIGIRLPDAQ